MSDFGISTLSRPTSLSHMYAYLRLPDSPSHSPLPPAPFWPHFYISLSPSPLFFLTDYLPPPLPSLLPPALFLCSMYCRILMWPVRELVKLSQLCACRCQSPTPPTTGSPVPLELSSSFYFDKWTEVGFFYNALSPSLCTYCFLWPSLHHFHVPLRVW